MLCRNLNKWREGMHVWLLHFLTKDSRIFQSDLQTPCGKWCSLDSVVFCIAEQFSFPALALCHVLDFYPSSHHSLSLFRFKAHHVCFCCSVLPWNCSIMNLPPRSSAKPSCSLFWDQFLQATISSSLSLWIAEHLNWFADSWSFCDTVFLVSTVVHFSTSSIGFTSAVRWRC